MSLKNAVRKSIVPLGLALALATTACTPMLSSSSALAPHQATRQLDAGDGPSTLAPMLSQDNTPPRRSRKFSWGKAIVLGMVIPSLVAVNMAAGMD